MSSAAIVAVTNSVTLWICPSCERRRGDLRKERPERSDATFSAAPCGACGAACAGVYACHAVYQAWACFEAQSERLLRFWQHRICYCRYISAWCLAVQLAQADGARRRAKIIRWLHLTFARGVCFGGDQLALLMFYSVPACAMSRHSHGRWYGMWHCIYAGSIPWVRGILFFGVTVLCYFLCMGHSGLTRLYLAWCKCPGFDNAGSVVLCCDVGHAQHDPSFAVSATDAEQMRTGRKAGCCCSGGKSLGGAMQQ